MSGNNGGFHEISDEDRKGKNSDQFGTGSLTPNDVNWLIALLNLYLRESKKNGVTEQTKNSLLKSLTDFAEKMSRQGNGVLIDLILDGNIRGVILKLEYSNPDDEGLSEKIVELKNELESYLKKIKPNKSQFQNEYLVDPYGPADFFVNNNDYNGNETQKTSNTSAKKQGLENQDLDEEEKSEDPFDPLMLSNRRQKVNPQESQDENYVSSINQQPTPEAKGDKKTPPPLPPRKDKSQASQTSAQVNAVNVNHDKSDIGKQNNVLPQELIAMVKKFARELKNLDVEQFSEIHKSKFVIIKEITNILKNREQDDLSGNHASIVSLKKEMINLYDEMFKKKNELKEQRITAESHASFVNSYNELAYMLAKQSQKFEDKEFENELDTLVNEQNLEENSILPLENTEELSDDDVKFVENEIAGFKYAGDEQSSLENEVDTTITPEVGGVLYGRKRAKISLPEEVYNKYINFKKAAQDLLENIKKEIDEVGNDNSERIGLMFENDIDVRQKSLAKIFIEFSVAAEGYLSDRILKNQNRTTQKVIDNLEFLKTQSTDEDMRVYLKKLNNLEDSIYKCIGAMPEVVTDKPKSNSILSKIFGGYYDSNKKKNKSTDEEAFKLKKDGVFVESFNKQNTPELLEKLRSTKKELDSIYRYITQDNNVVDDQPNNKENFNLDDIGELNTLSQWINIVIDNLSDDETYVLNRLGINLQNISEDFAKIIKHIEKAKSDKIEIQKKILLDRLSECIQKFPNSNDVRVILTKRDKERINKLEDLPLENANGSAAKLPATDSNKLVALPTKDSREVAYFKMLIKALDQFSSDLKDNEKNLIKELATYFDDKKITKLMQDLSVKKQQGINFEIAFKKIIKIIKEGKYNEYDKDLVDRIKTQYIKITGDKNFSEESVNAVPNKPKPKNSLMDSLANIFPSKSDLASRLPSTSDLFAKLPSFKSSSSILDGMLGRKKSNESAKIETARPKIPAGGVPLPIIGVSTVRTGAAPAPVDPAAGQPAAAATSNTSRLGSAAKAAAGAAGTAAKAVGTAGAAAVLAAGAAIGAVGAGVGVAGAAGAAGLSAAGGFLKSKLTRKGAAPGAATSDTEYEGIKYDLKEINDTKGELTIRSAPNCNDQDFVGSKVEFEGSESAYTCKFNLEEKAQNHFEKYCLCTIHSILESNDLHELQEDQVKLLDLSGFNKEQLDYFINAFLTLAGDKDYEQINRISLKFDQACFESLIKHDKFEQIKPYINREHHAKDLGLPLFNSNKPIPLS